MARLIRNVFLRAPNFKSILASANPQASLFIFKEFEPIVFQATIPIERKSITDAIDYDITTCHLTGSITIIGKRRAEPQPIDERICKGRGNDIGCELR